MHLNVIICTSMDGSLSLSVSVEAEFTEIKVKWLEPCKLVHGLCHQGPLVRHGYQYGIAEEPCVCRE